VALPDFQFRRSMRLSGYDYTQPGPYFITFCVAQRHCVLGDVINGSAVPSEPGLIVHNAWADLPRRYQGVRLDEFIVMPNHVHGVLYLPGWHLQGTDAIGLGAVIRTLKAASTRHIRQTGMPAFCWQSDYWDHIVRTGEELENIRLYIRSNPENWESDEDFRP
jgi:putative transposase